jgi:hypothetical protein
MKTYGRVYVETHAVFTSTLVGGEWLATLPYRFTPGEKASGILWIGEWVDLRAGLDDVAKRKFLTLQRVKALCYKPEGGGFDTRLGEFLNLLNHSGGRPWGLISL